VQHIFRDENIVVNDLAQQASSFQANRGKFGFLEKLDVLVYQIGQSDFRPRSSATIYSVGLSPAKLNSLVSETRVSRNSRITDESSKMMMVDPDDWRTPLVRYLENSGHIADRKVRQSDLKYVMLDNTFYHRIIDNLLLKCLSLDQSKIVMGEVYEGICGTHQSAHKIKWLLHHVGFYWSTMLNDCFRY
jgi:hypothetical protein